MNHKDLLLAIDNGTQSLKALIFDLEGQLLVKELVAFTPFQNSPPGPNRIRVLAGTLPVRDFGVNIITTRRMPVRAITTGTVINVDENGVPLRPAMLWLDQRKTHGCGLWGGIFGISGLRKTGGGLPPGGSRSQLDQHLSTGSLAKD